MQYNINEDYFNTWSEDMAYALGYLYADGSIYRGENHERYELTISGSHLETITIIRQLLSSGHPVRQIGPNSWQIKIGCRPLIERLEDLGLSDEKSLTLAYPNVPLELERHFIRGYFDGKGSFMVENGRRLISNFSGARLEFMEALRDRLVTHGLSRANIHQYGEGQASNMLRYYVRDTRRLAALMYTGARIYSRDQRDKYERGYRL